MILTKTSKLVNILGQGNMETVNKEYYYYWKSIDNKSSTPPFERNQREIVEWKQHHILQHREYRCSG